MTMDRAVDTVMNRGHVMGDGDLVVDCVLDRMVDLGHRANMDHAPDLLVVTEVHCVMRGAVNCVMSTVMSAMVVTSGAIGCDAGDKEGGCDEDPHGDECLC